MPAINRTLRGQLLLLIVVPMAAIIGFLTILLPLQHLETLSTDLRLKATTYGAVLRDQVRSAVAFDDRETAREVLASVTSDPDVTAVVLYGGPVLPLFVHGTPGPWVDRVRGQGGVLAVHRLARGLAVVAPVRSLEGPTGTLVIEVSNARFLARRRGIATSAALCGGLALTFGVLAAWLIARAHAKQVQLRDVVRAKLADAYAHLTVEMERRASVEVELRQAQKLESVGRLASGIAHEINTPVQYVSDSCRFLGDATEDLGQLLAEYRVLLREVHEGGRTAAEAVALLHAAEERADVGYLEVEIPLAVKRTLDGLERVATIVRAMKEFAYPERRAQTLVDVNRAIQTTLLVSNNEYKYVADVVTVLGDLPPVPCHLGELNQTILNIVVNAAHAIESVVTGTSDRGTITITTAAAGDFVRISIQDTGGGIREDHLEKVFDPFFTTKEFGKGTGQGLALARAVIDRHGGRLTVKSEVGRGATFMIYLPVESGATWSTAKMTCVSFPALAA